MIKQVMQSVVSGMAGGHRGVGTGSSQNIQDGEGKQFLLFLWKNSSASIDHPLPRKGLDKCLRALDLVTESAAQGHF